MPSGSQLPPFLSRISDLPADFEQLLAEAEADGFHALQRLRDDWPTKARRL